MSKMIKKSLKKCNFENKLILYTVKSDKNDK